MIQLKLSGHAKTGAWGPIGYARYNQVSLTIFHNETGLIGQERWVLKHHRKPLTVDSLPSIEQYDLLHCRSIAKNDAHTSHVQYESLREKLLLQHAQTRTLNQCSTPSNGNATICLALGSEHLCHHSHQLSPSLLKPQIVQYTLPWTASAQSSESLPWKDISVLLVEPSSSPLLIQAILLRSVAIEASSWLEKEGGSSYSTNSGPNKELLDSPAAEVVQHPWPHCIGMIGSHWTPSRNLEIPRSGCEEWTNGPRTGTGFGSGKVVVELNEER